MNQLVWFEAHSFIDDAIQREKSLKAWPRQWKINLIERSNPHWDDLFPALEGAHGAADDDASGAMGPRHKA